MGGNLAVHGCNAWIFLPVSRLQAIDHPARVHSMAVLVRILNAAMQL